VCDCVQLERKKRDVGCIFRVCGDKKPKKKREKKESCEKNKEDENLNNLHSSFDKQLIHR
jgi:hypothetical protein